MKNSIKLIFTLTAILLMQNGIKAQSWVISESDNSVTFIKGDWIKSIENGEEGENTTFIFNTATGAMVMISDDNMMYAEGTADDFCNSMRAMMKEMNAQMPEEQKKQMQAILNEQKAKPAPKVTVSKESGETILGYATTRYAISVDGELYEEKWISNDSRLKGVIQAYKKTLPFISKMTTCAMPEGWPAHSLPELSESYLEVEHSGLELKSISHEYGVEQPKTDVVEISNEDIDGSEFETPEDYQKVSFRELLENSGM